MVRWERISLHVALRNLFVATSAPHGLVRIILGASHWRRWMRMVVVVMMRTEANVENSPRSVCSVGDSLDNTGEAVTLLELLFEALGFLLHLGFDVVLLRLDGLLQFLHLGLKCPQFTDVVFQRRSAWAVDGLEIFRNRKNQAEMGRWVAPRLGLVQVASRRSRGWFQTEDFRRRQLLERNGEASGIGEELAVNGFDLYGQDLGDIIGFLFAVKTGRLPLEVQVVVEEPGILLDIGDAGVGTRAKCEVTVPFLRKVDSIQREVGGTAGLVVGGSSETQDLVRSKWDVTFFAA